MPKWYYDLTKLKATPSIIGGMEYNTEQRYRKEGARFIINVGTKMGLSNDTLATGVVYFHRFYMFHSFATFPRFVTACCCLFLAGKVEETPKKCKDIIKTARTHLTPRQFSQFGNDPKEEVMTLERILLQTIKFDLQVDHPYRHLLKYAKSLKGDKEKLRDMVQMAWTFINDSLCTTLCLQWEPEILGIAFMYLAGKLTKFEITDWDGRTPKQKYWWDMFVENVNTNFLEDICHQFLDNYGFQDPATPNNDSPPSSTTKKLKTSRPSSQKNSAESCKPPGKAKSNQKTDLKASVPIANSESVPPETSASLLPPHPEVPVCSEITVTKLPTQDSSVTSSVTVEVATPATVSVTNAHSSVVCAVPNIDNQSNQNNLPSFSQTCCEVKQTHPIVNEGLQTSTHSMMQPVPLLMPPPLYNNQRVSNVNPQQCIVNERFQSQPHNPCVAGSSFSGIVPHLTYQQPQSQFYQPPGLQEQYYNTRHASSQQSTCLPPARPPGPPPFPVGQTLPPPPQFPQLSSLPPPSVQPPLAKQFMGQLNQNQGQYCANGRSPTMPFPLHLTQVSTSNLRFHKPRQGISPNLPANGMYEYYNGMQTQSAHHPNSLQKF